MSATWANGPERRQPNALTIDVEDYFQVSALAPHIPREEWEWRPCRIERNVYRCLALLCEANAKATFFVLGWIAERYPHLVRAIAAAGHEVASHGYDHRRATEQTPAAFAADIARTRALLEELTGLPVLGYRAPSFSISAANPWALDCIAQAGYRYSSSVYPIRHDHYGMPDALRFAHFAHNGLLELPISTARLLNTNLPAGGGGYFRLFPYRLSRWLIERVNGREHEPAIFYFHPWEIDPGQPRVPALQVGTRVRHYLNLRHTEARLQRLLSDFAWQRIDLVFGEKLRAGSVHAVPGRHVAPASGLTASWGQA
jgi:polysaccharide deacetylase family protein (PEP-CTERM system associated)